MPHIGGCPLPVRSAQIECCLGGSPKGDRLMERSCVRAKVGRSGCRKLGDARTVRDDPRRNAAWEGGRRPTVSWDSIGTETRVCVMRMCMCARGFASSPPLLAFGR